MLKLSNGFGGKFARCGELNQIIAKFGMGIEGLDSFTRRDVPHGCDRVNIRNVIRNYATCDGKPTIVIYLRSLFAPLNRDSTGVLCGGRYELIQVVIERFFERLTQFGARLVFFSSGPRERVPDTSRSNNTFKYHRDWLHITDMVDQGTDVHTIQRKRSVPHNNHYSIKLLAKRYGQIRMPVEGDVRKEMVAYANSVNALAIVSNNSDFLIFEGAWRFWSSSNLDFEKLTTMEFNRAALRHHLGLESIEQMALLATLAKGNHFLRYEQALWVSKGPAGKFLSLAEFVRQPHDDILVEIFGPAADEGDLRERFQMGLDYYGTEDSPSEHLDIDFFKEHDFYKMWTGLPIVIVDVCVDLREEGPNCLTLFTRILLRVAAIIVYHRQFKRSNQEFRVSKRHESDFAEETHPLVFPVHVVPPTLEEIFSEDPDLTDTKLQLYAWTISDSLDHRKLAKIPPKLMPTVATIYLLVEARLIELFEADLLLQVAYEIAYKKYDMFQIRYPDRLDSRAFRVALFYAAICRDTTKALAAVGLDTLEYPGYPLFDGVLFHNLYRKWARGEGELEAIDEWRIYEGVC